MKRKLSDMLAFTLGMAICAGCTVKEDRSVCPSLLILDFSEVRADLVGSVCLGVTASDGFFFADTVPSASYTEDYHLNVPRGTVTVNSWAGAEYYDPRSGLRIPEGEDCPPVYLHHSSLSVEGEVAREVVTMRKNHCRLTINMTGDDMDVRSLVISGNADGYYPDGSVSRGVFRYEVIPELSGSAAAVLPRQYDNSLLLEIDDGTGIAKIFPIGEYIVESGYDWTAPDLEDITVDLDFAVTCVTLTVRGWDEEHKFDVVI